MILHDSPNSAVIRIANDTRPSVEGTYEGIQGKRLSLEASERIAACTPVSVQYNDAMFLGEVVACCGLIGGTWHLEVKVEQILTGLQSLMSLRNSLLGENVRQPLGMVPAGARN